MNVEIGIEMYRGSTGCRQGLQLDIGCVIQRLFAAFPGIEFEEEYFRRHVEVVRQISAFKPNKPSVRIAIRDAEERGPRFGFTICSSIGSSLKGSFDRHCLNFKFDDKTVDPALRARAEQFLASFALNRYENDATELNEIVYR